MTGPPIEFERHRARRGSRYGRFAVKEISRAERVPTAEVIQIAVETVRSTPGNDVDDCAGVASEFRQITVGG